MAERVRAGRCSPVTAVLLCAACVAANGQPGASSGTVRADSAVAAALRAPGSLQSRVRFSHLTTTEGLSHDSVFAILQDRHGFLWFGTQAGLNRYDGYRVTHFRHDPKNLNSLAADFIQFLFEDSHGSIWSGRSSITRFDPATGKFTRFGFPGGRRLASAMAEDSSGSLYTGVNIGQLLHRLDPKTGKTNSVELASESSARGGVHAILKDGPRVLWLGTHDGLVRYDLATGVAQTYPRKLSDPAIPPAILGIAKDKTGNLWLAVTEGTDDWFDVARGVYARRTAPPNLTDVGSNIYNAVLVDDDGIVYLGSARGLKVLDPATGASAELTHNPADPHSLTSNEVNSLVKDRDGSIWVGTKSGGVNRFSPDDLKFGAFRSNPGNANSLSDNNVRSIYRDRSGIVWIGTYEGGLNRFDPVSGRFTHFRHDARNPRSLDHDTVYSIYEDRAGALWIGTGLGLNRLDRNTGSFTRFARGGAGRSVSPTYSLLETRNGDFWIGTSGHRALLDRRTGSLTLAGNEIGLAFHEDRGGNLWSISAHGLQKRDPSGKIREIRLGGTVQINFIHEDAEGLLWLATETGLLRFDPKSETTTTFTTGEGLPDNVVQCILPGHDGNLWLSTNHGLSRFDPRAKSFVNYDYSDGLQGESFNRKSCYASPDGTLYFGGLNGFNIFHPRQVPAKPRQPRVVLTELRIDGRTVPIGAGSVLPKPIWQLDTLSLSHRQDNFSVEFAALNYSNPAETDYRFKLDGFEGGWTVVDSRNRNARYTGLVPGDYTLLIQASMDGHTWTGPERSLAVLVAPPWWMNLWFRSAVVLVVASLLIGGYTWRVNMLQERELRLKQLVEQRTAELTVARNQAEQARLQAEQANRAKSVFLAHMSHELRTPLNAILGFSNLLRARATSADETRDLGIINRSGEHLLTLINDILDVAKIEAGRMVLETAPCDLKALVRDVTDMMRVRANEKLLSLIVIEEPGVPQYVRTDSAKVRQVLINLLGNAIKFTNEGSVTLRLSARPADSAEQVLVQVEVEDTGIGIAPENQERIFRPFEQAATRGQKGTGLGLAITKQITDLMGGTIRLESALGKGSRFRMELPMDIADMAEAPAGPVRGRVTGLLEGQPEYRILAVDDDEASRTVLQRLLSDAGFAVRSAADGADAVEVFRSWRPHFIWMDLQMPVMGGIEATRHIRKLEGGRDVKIAALTASGLDTNRAEVLKAGLDDYLPKPCPSEDVFDCMTRHLGVQYRRAETAPAPNTIPSDPVSTAIAALPAELRVELRQAVTTLNAARIASVIDKIGAQDGALASALSDLAKRFSYTVILRAIDNSEEKSAASVRS